LPKQAIKIRSRSTIDRSSTPDAFEHAFRAAGFWLTLRGIHLIAILICCAAAFLASADIAVAESFKLRVASISSIDAAALQAAKIKGFFDAEGLDVEIVPMVGGAAALPALAAGQVQIAASNISSMILSAQQGLGFQIIAGGDSTGDTAPDLAGMIAKPGVTISGGKDLEGKRLGVNTRKDVISLFAHAWAKKTGGDPDLINYFEVPFPQMVDAVREGRVDAAFVVEPFLSAGVASGAVQVVAWPYSTVLPRIPIMQFAAHKSYIAANQDVITRFVRAYDRGADWMTENRGNDEWAALISSYTHIPADSLRKAASPLYPKTVDPAHIESIVALMKEFQLVKCDIDVQGLLYRTVLQVPQ
jgi:NitT/TauT family transport system substrate-binding protein